MGYFQVRYDSKVINYDRRGVIRLATELTSQSKTLIKNLFCIKITDVFLFVISYLKSVNDFETRFKLRS